jgi:transposase InsO family protein
MRHHGIRAIMARPRRVRTTDSRHDFPIAPNLLERSFIAAAPNRIWLADITYVETDQGWLYLATVMDLYSRRIVGWAMDDHLRADLPLAALKMAISAQRPGVGLIHHSDRGVQYASEDYRKVIRSAGFQASMSRKGDCYDNAPMESFFHTLKTELVHHRQYATRAEATRSAAKCAGWGEIRGASCLKMRSCNPPSRQEPPHDRPGHEPVTPAHDRRHDDPQVSAEDPT